MLLIDKNRIYTNVDALQIQGIYYNVLNQIQLLQLPIYYFFADDPKRGFLSLRFFLSFGGFPVRLVPFDFLLPFVLFLAYFILPGILIIIYLLVLIYYYVFLDPLTVDKIA